MFNCVFFAIIGLCTIAHVKSDDLINSFINTDDFTTGTAPKNQFDIKDDDNNEPLSEIGGYPVIFETVEIRTATDHKDKSGFKPNVRINGRSNPDGSPQEYKNPGQDEGDFTASGVGGQKVPQPDGSDVMQLKWHVGIYDITLKPYKQVCGGTLVTPYRVISAAHCFWNATSSEIRGTWLFHVAAGKQFATWDEPKDVNVKTSNIIEITIPQHFRGKITNFQANIAVVHLITPFYESPGVKPICINFDYEFDKQQLKSGNLGTVVGWGLTAAKDAPSPTLDSIKMPYVSVKDCLDQTKPYLLKLLTSDKICAKVETEKPLCSGDNGAGLVFFKDNVPYLRGVVSVTPHLDTLCKNYFVASFTHILTHKDLLLENLPGYETECLKNYPNAVKIEEKGCKEDFRNGTIKRKPVKFVCNCLCNNSNKLSP